MTRPIAAFAPGRVNLIGEHTDYTGGLAFPMAISLGTRAAFHPRVGSRQLEIRSRLFSEAAFVPLDLPPTTEAVARTEPSWARYAAAVVAVIEPARGGVVEVTGDLPIGAGLSSSASFELALALALGYEGPPRSLATTCQRAEELAFGSKTGILDQLASASAREGSAMFLDCKELTVEHVAVPGELEIVIVDSKERRAVAETAYEERRLECMAAEQVIGPLRDGRPGDEKAISDRLLRRRARHVISENERVRRFKRALEEGDLAAAGRLMDESHESLARDYEVSTSGLDDLVGSLRAVEGVLGARLTGAGFGGCVVALSRPGALAGRLGGRPHWLAEPAGGAQLTPG